MPCMCQARAKARVWPGPGMPEGRAAPALSYIILWSPMDVLHGISCSMEPKQKQVVFCCHPRVQFSSVRISIMERLNWCKLASIRQKQNTNLTFHN